VLFLAPKVIPQAGFRLALPCFRNGAEPEVTSRKSHKYLILLWFPDSSKVSVDNYVDSSSIARPKPYKSRLRLVCLKIGQKNKTFLNQ
jgi:hypothetical protein